MLPNPNDARANVLVVEDEMLLRMRAVDMVEDAGFMAVEATNADGIALSNASARFLFLANFTSGSPVTVAEGKTLKLVCKFSVSGDPPPSGGYSELAFSIQTVFGLNRNLLSKSSAF